MTPCTLTPSDNTSAGTVCTWVNSRNKPTRGTLAAFEILQPWVPKGRNAAECLLSRIWVLRVAAALLTLHVDNRTLTSITVYHAAPSKKDLRALNRLHELSKAVQQLFSFSSNLVKFIVMRSFSRNPLRNPQ